MSLGLEIINNNNCLYCGKKIISFKTSFDWNNRKYHKICYKKFKEEEKIKLENKIDNYITSKENIKKQQSDNEIINILTKWGYTDNEAKEKLKSILSNNIY